MAKNEKKEKKETKEDKFAHKVLKTLKKTESGNGHVVIHIISWGGRAGKLEKRPSYEGDDGEMRFGKAQGFTREDFELLLEKKNTILKLLK